MIDLEQQLRNLGEHLDLAASIEHRPLVTGETAPHRGAEGRRPKRSTVAAAVLLAAVAIAGGLFIHWNPHDPTHTVPVGTSDAVPGANSGQPTGIAAPPASGTVISSTATTGTSVAADTVVESAPSTLTASTADWYLPAQYPSGYELTDIHLNLNGAVLRPDRTTAIASVLSLLVNRIDGQPGSIGASVFSYTGTLSEVVDNELQRTTINGVEYSIDQGDSVDGRPTIVVVSVHDGKLFRVNGTETADTVLEFAASLRPVSDTAASAAYTVSSDRLHALPLTAEGTFPDGTRVSTRGTDPNTGVASALCIEAPTMHCISTYGITNPGYAMPHPGLPAATSVYTLFHFPDFAPQLIGWQPSPPQLSATDASAVQTTSGTNGAFFRVIDADPQTPPTIHISDGAGSDMQDVITDAQRP